MNYDNSFKILSLLIKNLDIRVTRKSIINELQKNPAPTSLLAISEALNNWSIPNAAYKVTFEELLESEIPQPFIACFRREFVLVTAIDKKRVNVSNGLYNNQSLGADEFIKHFRGTILAFRKDVQSGESDYTGQRRKEIVQKLRIPFVISGLAVILVSLLLLNQTRLPAFNWHIWFLILFKTAGLATSILLLIQSIDANNPLIKKICGADDKKNCNAILSTSAAKISDELTWSEAGFFYYAGTWLLLLFNMANSSLMQILAVLNLLSLPYTFYSVYYQWRVARQWCVFCCAVQALLWLEFFVFTPYLLNGIQAPGLHQWIMLVAGMLVPILFWVFIKPQLIAAQQLPMVKQDLYKYKYDKELFQKVLSTENKYALLAEEDTIVMGNREAKNTITLVSNPFCMHCSKAHKILDDLLNIRADLKLQLIFITRSYATDIDHEVVNHFIALKSGRSEVKLKKAINGWYDQKKKNYELWKKDYPATEPIVAFDALSKQNEWCRIAGINSTPSIFINGRRLPAIYQPDDVKYIL